MTKPSGDWDSYLDGYNYSSGEQYRDDEDRPSFENLLTRQRHPGRPPALAAPHGAFLQ